MSGNGLLLTQAKTVRLEAQMRIGLLHFKLINDGATPSQRVRVNGLKLRVRIVLKERGQH
jgi:hypothetical protein